MTHQPMACTPIALRMTLGALLLGAFTTAHAQLVLVDRTVTGNADGNVLVVPEGTALDAPLEVRADSDYSLQATGRITTHSAVQSGVVLAAGSAAFSLNAEASWTQEYSGAAAGTWASAQGQGTARWDLDVLQDTSVTLVSRSFNFQPLGYSSVSFSRVLADGSLSALSTSGDLQLAAGRYAVLLNTYSTSSAFNVRGAMSGGRSDLASLTLSGNFSTAVAAVPEPGTWALMGLGLLGLAAATRRRSLV
ncbi:putative secreted protein with PEP-CTERM sorting signal/MYXO-CTERM domain-containing protein [Aquabacterium commune]|uniref:Putative secreted protein with PEP-CTERM sorting signal/MYXO-CTERM domain-containing protein n=1 Tax=Aquabacterium commune TaxID=70586 RepID=A0A4V6PVD1_9BURK|nr:PEP-CTERM sorting domain-containing protein [Aquabacterium commune]TDP81638.1 putative secreted protein with PEP-CTERM sorting signal/MYXO-CTERM domain-containing protein [Aquabacterium commune]